MKYIVCVKQVPGTSDVQIDETTGNLIRDGAEAKLNPYDLYALELALSMREATGGEVLTLSMGPPQAKQALYETVCMGGDGGILLTDRAFAGADVLATACALSAAVRTLNTFDVIVCGKQTTDGDTAQVGAELSELLGIPMAANVTQASVGEGGELTVRCETEDEVAVIALPTPCLICAGGGINTPRLPSYKRKKSMSDDAVRVMTLRELCCPSPELYGSAGSPTRVERIFPPPPGDERQTLRGSGEELAAGIHTVLKKRKFISVD